MALTRKSLQAWSIEIRCAIEVGALGEEKVSQPLWGRPRVGTNANVEDMLPVEPSISDDPYCAARCYRGSAAAVGVLSPHVPETTNTAATSSYPNWHVVYKNATEANLLKPSLRPSAYYSRTPISRIMKGATVRLPKAPARCCPHSGAASRLTSVCCRSASR